MVTKPKRTWCGCLHEVYVVGRTRRYQRPQIHEPQWILSGRDHDEMRLVVFSDLYLPSAIPFSKLLLIQVRGNACEKRSSAVARTTLIATRATCCFHVVCLLWKEQLKNGWMDFHEVWGIANGISRSQVSSSQAATFASSFCSMPAWHWRYIGPVLSW